MSAYCIYLSVPPYLAQWYAHTCLEHHHLLDDACPHLPYVPLSPIDPIKGSHESRILERWLQKQPTLTEPTASEQDNLALSIPYFRDKDPRVYNYLGPHARRLLTKGLFNNFCIQLWEELHTFTVVLNRQDENIYCFMERHGIECTETNWNAIAKVYQRLRNNYKVQKCRKNRSTSTH